MHSTKIFYAGRMRPFKHVGHHPQFEHIHQPPEGYEFVTDGGFSLGTSIGVMKSLGELFKASITNGSELGAFNRFIRSRSIRAQMSVPSDVKLAFLPSTPFFLGQIPWVIEIEDTTTLFVPFAKIAGKRHDPRIFGTDGIYDSGFLPVVKSMLQSAKCRAIICHVRSTAESIPVLFGDPALAKKVVHIPLGIEPRPTVSRAHHNESITMLFTNSWNQAATGFYLRGGLDVLEAYSSIYAQNRRVRLIVRSKLPEDLAPRYREIIECCNVQVIDGFLSTEQIEALFSSADIYVLPSARLHVVSILQAMAYGLAVVVSDGWGIAEYVDHGTNGCIVPGRYGTCSWMDSRGILKEDYRPLFSPNAAVAENLTQVLLNLIDREDLRRQLGEAAIEAVATKFSIARWNRGLAQAFTQALS